MENREKAKIEMDEYCRSVTSGRDKPSIKEITDILRRNNLQEDADQMTRGSNGEGSKK